MTKKLKIFFGCALIAGIVNIFMFVIFIPKFELYSKNGDKIINTDFEYPEQILLYKYLESNDIVLQLGGNIGTSCILADKILSNKDKQVCVEPNKDMIEVLEKNKRFNNANFKVINGILSNKTCFYKKSEYKNDLMKLGVSYHHENAEFDKFKSLEQDLNVKCFDFYEIEKSLNDKINVLFFDCEGCACEFLEMYENSLENITKIFIEQDQKNTCDYSKKVFPLLIKYNFTKSNNFISFISNDFYQIWQKNNNIFK